MGVLHACTLLQCEQCRCTVLSLQVQRRAYAGGGVQDLKPRLGSPEPRLGDPKPRLGDLKPRLGSPEPRPGVSKLRLGDLTTLSV